VRGIFATVTAQAVTFPPRIGPRADLPVADPIALAARYRRTDGAAPVSQPFAGESAVGSSRTFNVLRITPAAASRTAPPEMATIAATLHATSAHAYFYVEDAVGADPAAVQEEADMFEATVWPAITGVFGEPDTPGVDGDPRIIVLQADIGSSVGGYFNSDDTYLSSVRPLSNEAEMVYLSRTLRPGGSLFNLVLAHEFQHLIHEKNDGSEEAWVNEGLSDTAMLLVGGSASNRERFEAAPETQLNAWPFTNAAPHYGAAAAFMRYVADRFGGDASLGAIARQQGDGQQGVDEFLAGAGTPLRFQDMFADWIVANVLEGGDGIYGRGSRDVIASVQYELAPGGGAASGEAHQFGTDNYALTGVYEGGDYVLRFDGEEVVDLLPPSAGDYLPQTSPEDGRMRWSNRGDEIDTTMTYRIDLASAEDPELVFEIWYDIEEWYDWGYVSVSTDDGATWTALAGEHTSDVDPVRVAYGPGYTGTSGNGDEPAWVEERVDLSAYTGESIMVRFEYVTDAGTHGEGWAVRNLYPTASRGNLGWGGEPDLDGWIPLGETSLAQSYAVRVILTHDDGAIEVLDVPLDDARDGELRFSTDGVVDAVLAVAGTTEGTQQLAPYTVELTAE
jgi:hypothetical protein